MTRRVSLLLVAGLTLIAFAGCNKPVLGFVTETYVSQNQPGQTLEFQSQETLKGFVHGVPSPVGNYTLFNAQKGSAGKFRRTKTTFILTPTDALLTDHPEEIKLAFQKDDSLIDEAGNIWRLQNRSHGFRTQDEPPATRQALHAR